MESLSAQLLNFLTSQNSARSILDKILDANPDHANVYYVLPLYNLKKLYQSGGIRSHNNVREDFIDLSGHNIQFRRVKPVELCNRTQKTRAFNVHDCINLFLNPLNDTFFHFRRNARVIPLQKDNDLDRTLCILELDLGEILNLDRVYWGISDRNVAVKGAIITSNHYQYSRFNWNAIYSLRRKNQNSQENFKQSSAEFIVYIDKPQAERLIPTTFIRRILILEGNIDDIQNYLKLTHSPIYTIKQDKTYSVFDDPLEWDKKFLWNILNLKGYKIPISSFSNALNKLANAQAIIGHNLSESYYDNASIANSGYHGVSHTIRVMFWVLFLADIMKALGKVISEEDIKTALLAAFVHDLARNNHTEEESHGELVANKYHSLISEILPHHKVESCLKAVMFHSKETGPPNSDVVWRLLKDADALDRGRYAPPNGTAGCQLGRLKLDIFGKQSLALKCGWIAFWLAKIARFTNNESVSPYSEFKMTLLRSFQALERDFTLTQWQRDRVQDLIYQLESA